jgi:hypothetical protein
VRRGTGALATGRAAAAAAGAAAASEAVPTVGSRSGMQAYWGAGLSKDDSDAYGFVSKKASKNSKAAAWDSSTPSGTAAANAASSSQRSSAAADTAAAASGCEPGSAAWRSALKQLLLGGGASYKWRVILPPPSGDRVGPYTSAELNGWLLQGLVPKGVSREDARQVTAEPGSLQLCGILASDYNAQRLPGETLRPWGLQAM